MTDSDTPRILLIDDEPSIREPLSEYLEGQGFAVSDAASAAEARSVLRAKSIDLVVSDIMMPGEDGLSLTRHLRETSHIPVILLTARAEDTERIIGLEIGADDYVVKPFNPRELVARIRTVLRRTQANGRALDAGGTSYAFGPGCCARSSACWSIATGARWLCRRANITCSTRWCAIRGR